MIYSFQNIMLAIVLTLLYYACNTSTKTMETEVANKGKKSITVPSFNSDSAYNFIKQQLEFGPRVPGTEGHQLCGDYLINKLEKYGAKVVVQNFTENSYRGEVLHLRNIIGSYNLSAKKRILLAAHWDTRPFADKDFERRREAIPGANDGASGVAVLLEIARKLNHHEHPNVGIDFIFFDGEDYGAHVDDDAPKMIDGKMKIWWCLGSQYWSENLHKKNYSAYYGVLVDMVGAEDAKFYKEGGSMQFAPKVVNKIWTTARYLGYGNYFINANGPGITDDHIFVNTIAKIPMVNIIDYDPDSPTYFFPDYHHTHEDNLSLIDPQTLQSVGETLLYVLYHE